MKRTMLVCGTMLALAGAVAAQTPPDTVYYDADRIPHIYAATDAAAMKAFGYAQGMDFPVLSSWNILSCSGSFASLIGEDGVSNDLRMARWRIGDVATRHASEIAGTDAVPLLQAFCDGLNLARSEWLSGNPTHPGSCGVTNVSGLARATMPPLVGGGLTADQLNNLLDPSVTPITVDHLLRYGVVVNGLGVMLAAEGTPVQGASNGWMVGKGKSATGRGIMLADPHLGLDLTPDHAWLRPYFATVSGSTMKWAGWAPVGWPTFGYGFGAHISLALTSNSAQTHLVWTSPYDPATQTYQVDGVSEPILTDTVNVTVWQGPGQTSQTRSYALRYATKSSEVSANPNASPSAVYWYPIVYETCDNCGANETGGGTGGGGGDAPPPTGQIWFARGTFQNAPCVWKFLLDLQRSADVTAARSLFSTVPVTNQNYLIQDDKGGMFYLWATRVPDLAAQGFNGDALEVQDGSSSALRWASEHTNINDYPQEFESGTGSATSEVWINNNVNPWFTRPTPSSTAAESTFAGRRYMTGGRPVSASQPYVQASVGGLAMNYRQQRAIDLLRTSSGTVSISDVKMAALDLKDNVAAANWANFNWAADQYDALLSSADLAAVNTLQTDIGNWVTNQGALATISGPAARGAALWTMVRAEYEALMIEYGGPTGLDAHRLRFLTPGLTAWQTSSDYATHRLMAWYAAYLTAVYLDPNSRNKTYFGAPSTTFAMMHTMQLVPGAAPQFIGGTDQSLFPTISSTFNEGIRWDIDPSGPVMAYPFVAGSAKMLLMDAGDASTGLAPSGEFLSVLGNSEIAGCSVRTSTGSGSVTSRFLSGSWTTLHTDRTTVQGLAVESYPVP